MYSDLDKNAKGGYIIEDAVDLNEVFDTALNVKKGQIFYGRQYGQDFEYYLQKLDTVDTILGLQGELYDIRNMDGRLIVDSSQTQFFTDSENYQNLVIQTALNIQGLPQVSVTSAITDTTDNDNISSRPIDSPWISIGIPDIQEEGDLDIIQVPLTDGRILEFVGGKLNRIIDNNS